MATSREWEYKPKFLSKYYDDFSIEYDIETENKMIDRQYDILDDIMESRDVGALEWFYYNWVSDIPNSIYDDMYDDLYESLLELIDDHTSGDDINLLYDFIDYLAVNFCLDMNKNVKKHCDIIMAADV